MLLQICTHPPPIVVSAFFLGLLAYFVNESVPIMVLVAPIVVILGHFVHYVGREYRDVVLVIKVLWSCSHRFKYVKGLTKVLLFFIWKTLLTPAAQRIVTCRVEFKRAF